MTIVYETDKNKFGPKRYIVEYKRIRDVRWTRAMETFDTYERARASANAWESLVYYARIIDTYSTSEAEEETSNESVNKEKTGRSFLSRLKSAITG